ncbi:acyl-CoA dehydrogenase family protein [Williamwhitmania taraxaci]|uniref:Acyl-CoA dehydrogenase n=1 Tax=Williamwhitmania taraxaci TaxID=1640674 RepID=A0A1G6H504_9BACT|nr:acyl-CoA dehydrogenase family protein [Williamwhitmania taraxaci]SDB89349.1 Acyl-CoA dehydrogenase [Williamwhitmania taraxaci]
MDYDQSKIHQELRAKVRAFAQERVKPVAVEYDEKETFSVELTREMGQLGLFGIVVPKEYGGQGLDYMALVIAVEELAKVDGSQAGTLAAHNCLGVNPIYYYGTEEQRRKFLPSLCTGESVWAFGLTEPNAGSDALGVETTAHVSNNEWEINGKKTFISNGTSLVSGGITLMARTGERNGRGEISAILVPRSAGYEVERITGKMMWRASDTGKLFFNNIKVPESNILGEIGKGGRLMLETLDAGRLSIGAMGLGLAIGAYEESLAYANTRHQFGKPISSFQAVAFKLAEMAMKIEAARQLLYHAVWLKDNDKPFGKEAAMAKLFCSEVATFAATEGSQIHGAYGLVKGSLIERHFRDQRILHVGEGTSEILKLVIARKVGCKI